MVDIENSMSELSIMLKELRLTYPGLYCRHIANVRPYGVAFVVAVYGGGELHTPWHGFIHYAKTGMWYLNVAGKGEGMNSHYKELETLELDFKSFLEAVS